MTLEESDPMHEDRAIGSRVFHQPHEGLGAGVAHGDEVVQHLLTEFRQPLQVQSHLDMPGILVQLGHIQRT